MYMQFFLLLNLRLVKHAILLVGSCRYQHWGNGQGRCSEIEATAHSRESLFTRPIPERREGLLVVHRILTGKNVVLIINDN